MWDCNGCFSQASIVRPLWAFRADSRAHLFDLELLDWSHGKKEAIGFCLDAVGHGKDGLFGTGNQSQKDVRRAHEHAKLLELHAWILKGKMAFDILSGIAALFSVFVKLFLFCRRARVAEGRSVAWSKELGTRPEFRASSNRRWCELLCCFTC